MNNDRTFSDLLELQRMNLKSKILLSSARIREFYYKLDGNVYISFSGGKDSTVLLHLVRSMFPDVPAVYCDTGLEYPEVKTHVKKFDNVTTIRPSMSFRSVISEFGYPVFSKNISHIIDISRRCPDGRTATVFMNVSEGRYAMSKYKYMLDAPFKCSDKCCYIMKKKPLHEYEKLTGRFPFIGVMASESVNRQRAWLQHGCNSFDSKHISSSPLSFWTEQDILEYIVLNNLDIPSIYGNIIVKNGCFCTTNAKRTGCIFCAFGAHLEKSPNRFIRLYYSHPKLWNYCIKPLSDGGLGFGDVLDFCNIPYKPNNDIQISFFD